MTLDEILFVEDGMYPTYQVREDDGSLGFELDEIDGDADTYFTCRNCGQPLEELTELWRSGREADIIKLLG